MADPHVHRRPSLFNDDEETTLVVGTRPPRLHDLYHVLLRSPWWVDVLIISGLFFAANLLFAMGYLLSGGIANARPGSFQDAFFFSVQTMGTIGYGTMYPVTLTAHLLVTLQSLAGIFVLALATGIIFAKFSIPRARVVFSRSIAIHPMDGVPTLTFRIANERKNYLAEAQVRLSLMRTECTREGVELYRMRDLHLVRDRSPAFVRTWTVLHPITPESPLFGRTPEDLAEDETQIIVTLMGIDGTSSQTLHARHAWLHEEVRWGARLADIIEELGDGRIRLDMARFHDVVPTEPAAGFPYPRQETKT